MIWFYDIVMFTRLAETGSPDPEATEPKNRKTKEPITDPQVTISRRDDYAKITRPRNRK